MKLTSQIATIVGLVVLLTWLSYRAIDPEAERFDQALAELDRFGMIENALYHDVIAARAGMLRNYDPLVNQGNQLRASLQRLHDTAAIDAETTATVNAMESSVTARKSWSSSSRAKMRCFNIRCRFSGASASALSHRS